MRPLTDKTNSMTESEAPTKKTRKRKKSIGRVPKVRKNTKLIDTVSISGLPIFDVINIADDTEDRTNVAEPKPKDEALPKSSRKSDYMKLWRRSEIGKQSTLDSNTAYEISDKGKKTRNLSIESLKRKASKAAYEKSLKGKASKAVYEKSLKGKAIRARTSKTFISTDKGKAAYARSAKTFISTDKGKAAYARSAKTFMSTDQGKAAYKRSLATYRQSSNAQKTRAAYLKRTKNVIKQARWNRFQRDITSRDKPTKQIAQTKTGAMKDIRSYKVPAYVTSTFSRNRMQLLKTRQSVNIPSITVSDGRLKFKQFKSSRRRIEYKNASAGIMEEAIEKHGSLQDLLPKLFAGMHFKRYTKDFKLKSLSRYIINGALAQRDLWVKSIYYHVHQLQRVCKTVLAQIALASEEDKDEAALGSSFHISGCQPFFPEFSFKNSKNDYTCKTSKSAKSSEIKDPEEDDPRLDKFINPCTDNCIEATDDDIASFIALLEMVKDIKTKTCRETIARIDRCPDFLREPYQLIVEDRNHSKTCYTDNRCSSEFILLRRLNPHYGNVRKVYDLLNTIRICHEVLSDLDTAVYCGDFAFVMMLVNYKAPVVARVFPVNRPNDIINQETIRAKYGDHVTKFHSMASQLPEVPCISCDRKTVNHPSKLKRIKMSWKHIGNQAYKNMFSYLNSPERIDGRGETRINDFAGKPLCLYCWTSLNKNEIPRVSLANGMDTGKAPNFLDDLNQFEKIMLHPAMCYQTIIKLSPNSEHLPYNARMSSLKGYAVHIPIPLNETIKQLKEEQHDRLINPDDFIIVHGYPRKEKFVYRDMVRFKEKLHPSLRWFKEHNHLYKNIVNIPGDPDEKSSPDLDRPAFDSSDDGNGLVGGQGEEDVFFDADSVFPEVSAGDRIKEFLMSDVYYDAEEHIPSQDVDWDYDHEEHNDYRSLDYELVNDSTSLWLDSEKLTVQEVEKLKDLNKNTDKAKYVLVKGIMRLCREHLARGDLCQDCSWCMRNERTQLAQLCSDKVGFLNFRFIDIRYLANLLSQLKASFAVTDPNVCSKCTKNIRPSRLLSSKKLKNNDQKHVALKQKMEGMINDVQKKSLQYFKTIDELRVDGCLCQGCFWEQDRLYKTKNFRQKTAKTATVTKLKEHLRKTNTLCRQVTALSTIAAIFKKENAVLHCLRCKYETATRRAAVSAQVLDSLQTSTASVEDSLASTEGLESANLADDPVTVSYTDNDPRLIHTYGKCHYAPLDNNNSLSILTANMALVRQLYNIVFCVVKAPLACSTCLNDVKELLKTYGKITSGKLYGTASHIQINLGNMDTTLLKSLLVDARQRHENAVNLGRCYQCRKSSTSLFNNIETPGPDAETDSEGTHFGDDCDKNEEEKYRHFEASLSGKSNIYNSISNSNFNYNRNDNYPNPNPNPNPNSNAHSPIGNTRLDGGGDPEITSELDDWSDVEIIQDTEEAEKKEQEHTKRLLLQMSHDDFQNLVEQYTVTGLENASDNPGYLESLYQLLRVDDDPLPLNDDNLDILCFPFVFPYGIGGKKASRQHTVQPLMYERTRLLSNNGRVRRNIPYIFSLGQDNERRQITKGVFATIKNVKGVRNVDTISFLDMLKNNDQGIERRLSRTVNKIPGTFQYWLSQRTKLKAQIEKHGSPTWFSTFSPAEYDWDELIKYLREQNADLPGVQDLPPSVLIAKDPVLTSYFIHQRFKSLLTFILEAHPIGEVTNYFIRHEYQGRGTVHFHCFFWVKGAPCIGKDSDKAVADFIQKYVSCKLPDKDTEPDLHRAVTKYQEHKCRSYCLRTIKSGGKWRRKCRFGFPRKSSDTFQLHDVLSCLVGRKTNNMKKRLYDLARTDKESAINDYNPTLLLLWGANMDIQFLSENSFSIAEYITKYITKPEKSNLDMEFDEKSYRSAFQEASKFAYACLRSREMSAHEVVDRMLQNNGELWQCSDTFQFVPTTTVQYRTRTVKPIKVLEAQDGNNTEIYYPDLIHDFYPRRPESLSGLSLYEFVEQYERVWTPAKKDQGKIVVILDKVESSVIAKFRMRNKNNRPIIYHHEYDVEKRPEMFYYSLLALYKPWREESDILGGSQKFEEEFNLLVDALPLLKNNYRIKEYIKRARKKMEDDADKATNVENDKCDPEDEDDDLVIDQALQDFETVNDMSDIKTEAELYSFVDSLNVDQRRVYDRITSGITHVLDHEEDSCTIPDCKGAKPLLMYVSGQGGTGKSYLITALLGFFNVQRNVYNRSCDSIVGAPTGLAAANISGQTLHSIFNVPVEHGGAPKHSQLNKAKLDLVRVVMKRLKCVLIDEVSMVSNVLLFLINLRLGEVFREQTESLFGNKSVILFGDLLQLSPVNARPPFQGLTGPEASKVTGGMKTPVSLWKEFGFEELNINQRQKGNANNEWKNILSRVRLGIHTNEDLLLLKERLIPLESKKSSPDAVLDELVQYHSQLTAAGHSPVCLFPTREMVDRFNFAILTQDHPDFERIQATDDIACRQPRRMQRAQEAVRKLDNLSDPRNTGGLDQCLPLSIGVKLMLRQNLDVKRGLVNGSIGEVDGFSRRGSDGIVNELSIKFAGIDAPETIKRVSRKINIFPGATLHRTQFPVSIAYAMTIHKAQGLSLNCVIADIGSKTFAPGMSYVCLSRVTSLLGLHLVNLDPGKIIPNKSALAEYMRLGSRTGTCGAKKENQKRHANTALKFTERVWYISSTRKKAISTIDEAVCASKAPNKQKSIVIPKGKSPAATSTGSKTLSPVFKDNSPTTSRTIRKGKTAPPELVNVPLDGATTTSKTGKNRKVRAAPPGLVSVPVNDIEASVRQILQLASLSQDRHIEEVLSLVDRESIELVYAAVIQQYANIQSDSFLNRLANELNPDPLGRADLTQQKWLSSEIMNWYGQYLVDTSRSRNGPSVFLLSPYARFLYLQNRSNYMEGCVQQTHIERQYSTFESPTEQHSVDVGVARAGDPLEKDILIMFGNDHGNHWYAVVIDRRPRPFEIICFDSGSVTSTAFLNERGQFAIMFINQFRSYVISQLKLSWAPVTIYASDFRIRDGFSVRQKNGFDCGVYSLFNVERYLLNKDHKVFEQNTLPLVRAKILMDLYVFGNSTGILDDI